MIFQILGGVVLAYLAWSLLCLEANARRARALKVPIARIPFDTTNVLWLTFQPLLWALLDRLPVHWSSYPDFIRLSRRDWQFREKSELAVRLGPVWALVTPVTIYLQFNDPQTTKELFARPSQFMRPVKEYKLLEVYGPCISTAGWDDWARHRKIMAAPFNESIMGIVWNESVSQSRAMLRSWVNAKAAGIPNVQQDASTLALDVLAATALKKSYQFRGSADAVVEDEAGSYRDTLQTVLDYAILIMLIPYRYLQGPLVPRKLVRVGDAARAFKSHMVKILDQETQALKQNQSGSGGILTSFIRAIDKHETDKASTVKRGLSPEEILGNLFVINFAGYDTSAAALAFCFYLSTVYPDVQTWLAEEIAAVSAAQGNEDWDYKTMFPRLKRCQAVLLETLRLFPPIVSIPKWTGPKTQTLDMGHQTLTIPPGVYTSPQIMAIHTHPDYWEEPYLWKPSRWIRSEQTSGPNPFDSETLLEPTPNTYFPWSDGPQNCPGKKFVQVEVVAVLASLFRKHRLAIKKQPGESEQVAKDRVLHHVNNVNMEVILRMEYVKDLRLICTEA